MAGPISVQELKERFDLTQDQLDVEISEEHLRDANRIIGNHNMLGPELGLTPEEMTDINQERSPELQRSAMLRKWKEKLAWKATYSMLLEALLKCSRADRARDVCELLTGSDVYMKESPSSTPPAHSITRKRKRQALGQTMDDPEVMASAESYRKKQKKAEESAMETDEELMRGESGSLEHVQEHLSVCGWQENTTAAQSISREEQPPGQIVEAPEVSQPELGQAEGDKGTSQLRQKVKHMEKTFEDLCDATSGDLEERKVPIRKIRKSLYARRASDTQTDTDLVAGHRHEIREADTVDDLFEILSIGKCWDFLNPGLLNRIIDDHCSESQAIQYQKNEYQEELEQFRKETTARQFAKICNVSTPSPKFSEVVFEMGKNWDNATLEDVENLNQKLQGQGFVDDLLRFMRSKNSSLSLVWAFPRSCPVSTSILCIPPSFYLEQGIRRVLVKGVCVVDVKFEEEQEEMDAKQMDIRLQLQKRLQQKEGEIASLMEEMATAEKIYTEKLKEMEKVLKATIESNEEQRAALEEAKSVQRTLQEEISNLESRVKKYELQMQEAGLTWSSVSAPQLHALEQEKLVKKEDTEIADYEDEITRLNREVETLKKLLEKDRGSGKGSFTEAMSEYRDVLLRQHEDKERELLQELKRMKGVEGRKPTPPTADHIVESRGIRYDMKLGCAGGNTKEVMILVSVGSEFPAGVQVQPRVRNPALAEKAIQTHGRLPPIVTGLHEEAAADLMARASLELQDCSSDLVHLCLDFPGKQHSKEYYLKTIEEYLKHCQQPAAILYYLGHSEECTGNWCFKDGTISFQEIFDLYRRHCPGKLLTIMSDCCYSGNWVRECAKTLDSLGIPPCGHRAREQGILIKVFASCQPDQKAAEPCYSVEGMTVEDDGTLTVWDKELSHQKSLWCDATRLTCCRGPDESCRSEEALKNWTWQDAVDGGLRSRLFIVRGIDQGRLAWRYVLLSNKSEEYKEKFKEATLGKCSTNVSEWGYVIESRWGEDPPEDLRKKLSNWMSV